MCAHDLCLLIGYADFTNEGCNPFSNKIVLMDEVHNLVRPSAEILRNEKRMLMLQRLRQLLRTAENSTIIGLTGTPLCDVPAEANALLNLIKGRQAVQKQLGDEGFISYYMEAPPSVFPSVSPAGVPRALPMTTLRSVPLRNLPIGTDRRRHQPEGNRRQYHLKVADELRKLDDPCATVRPRPPALTPGPHHPSTTHARIPSLPTSS